MEITKERNDFQLSQREIQLIRLKKIRKTQGWLAKELGLNDATVSLYFKQQAFPELTDRVEKRITREERSRIAA